MNDKPYDKCKYYVDDSQQKFQDNKGRKMFCKKMIVLGNVDVIKTCYAEIKDDVKHEREIEQRKVKSEVFSVYCVLPVYINEKYMNRLDEQIQKKKKGKVGYKFFLHENYLQLLFSTNIISKSVIIPINSTPHISFTY